MILWEKIINNDPLETLLEREDLLMGDRKEGRKGINDGSYKEQKSVVLNLISIQEEFYKH